jgi:hypothetical protein
MYIGVGNIPLIFASIFLPFVLNYTSTISQDKVDSFQEYILSSCGLATGEFQRQVDSFNIQELKGLGGIKASLSSS